jgi:hypothetical protein
MKEGRCGTMTHDYKRSGTTTLFAALNVLEGTLIGQKRWTGGAAGPARSRQPAAQEEAASRRGW